MTADDTSRDALIEQVENLLMDERDKYPRVHNDAPSADLAEAVVDAVVMPLVQERDTWHERWRQLMRAHEAVFKERDELEAENERLRTALRDMTSAEEARRLASGSPAASLSGQVGRPRLVDRDLTDYQKQIEKAVAGVMQEVYR